MVYNFAQSKIQEIPIPTRKFHGGRTPFIANHGNPPMAQQSKATTTASSTAPPTRDDTLWPNTMPASTNLFVARVSWPIPLILMKSQQPPLSRQKRQRRRPNQNKQLSPHALILTKPQKSKPAEEEGRWGPQCSICMQSTPNIKAEDTEEEWNGDRQKKGRKTS